VEFSRATSRTGQFLADNAVIFAVALLLLKERQN